MLTRVFSCLLWSATTAMFAPPHFVMNLDLPPAARWDGAVGLVLAAHPFEHSFGAAFADHNASMFNKLTYSDWAMMGDTVKKHWPEQAAELQGISRQFIAAGHCVTYEYLCGWVFFHELAHSDLQDAEFSITAACTGIVAQDLQGNVIHAGNMDQSPPQVRNVTLSVAFTSANRTLMRGVDWYWFTTGLTRLVRRGVASLQENWRTAPAPHDVIPAADVKRDIAAGTLPQVWAFRHALSADVVGAAAPPLAAPTFDSVMQHMMGVPLAAPYYVIMAGPGPSQGAVFARNNSGVPEGGLLRLADVTREAAATAAGDGLTDGAGAQLRSGAPPGGGGAPGWFIAQSNYDHWLPDRPDDPRRTAAERTLVQFGQPASVSAMGLFAVCSTYPVHNPHTAYTAVMEPSTGQLHAFVRQSMCPDDPGQSVVQDSRYCLAGPADGLR
jgi:hypothetical protein